MERDFRLHNGIGLMLICLLDRLKDSVGMRKDYEDTFTCPMMENHWLLPSKELHIRFFQPKEEGIIK